VITTAWEYEILDSQRHDESPHHFLAELNALGNKGWQLVLEVDDVLIFMRPTSPTNSNQAVKAVLTIKGADGMPTLVITVDDTGAAASLSFEDKLNDPTAAPFSSDGTTPVVVAYTTDNAAVATIDPTSGALTATGVGTVGVGATVTDAVTGAAALEPDGVTPWAPAPLSVEVDPGKAVADQFTVSDPTGT
jgi:hypothetical protein